MNVQDLRYLSVAADALNLTRAAGALGLHASTISRRITRLEDELGVTLFERSRQGLRLTKAGRLAMVHVQRALSMTWIAWIAQLRTANPSTLKDISKNHLPQNTGGRNPLVFLPIVPGRNSDDELQRWNDEQPLASLSHS